MIDQVVAANRVRKYLGDLDVEIEHIVFEPHLQAWRAEVYNGKHKIGEVFVNPMGIILEKSSSVEQMKNR